MTLYEDLAYEEAVAMCQDADDLQPTEEESLYATCPDEIDPTALRSEYERVSFWYECTKVTGPIDDAEYWYKERRRLGDALREYNQSESAWVQFTEGSGF
jgi:hypothetical protein